jgi:hypothetical protein
MDMLRLTASYSWIRFGARNLATNETQILYCLVDNDLADGQLAHAAGRTPSKLH